jgi:hypothetical protein
VTSAKNVHVKSYLLEVLEEDTQNFQNVKYACVFLPQFPCFIFSCVEWREIA